MVFVCCGQWLWYKQWKLVLTDSDSVQSTVNYDKQQKSFNPYWAAKSHHHKDTLFVNKTWISHYTYQTMGCFLEIMLQKL